MSAGKLNGRPLPIPSTAPKPEPATREELITVLCAIVAQAKMPPGRRRSDIVKVPAALVQQADALIKCELAAMVE